MRSLVVKCLKCGKCCNTNTFLIRDLFQALHESNKFCFFLVDQIPEIREEIVVIKGMESKQTLKIIEGIEDEMKILLKEIGTEEFLDRIQSDCKKVFMNPDDLVFPTKNEFHNVYKLVLKLSILGHRYNFNPFGEHCVFLRDSNGEKICLIHPKYLVDIGIRLKTDPRGHMCADYFCRKLKE